MNKTITMYELLGLVKDGKAPKKIKYKDIIYELNNNKIWVDEVYSGEGNGHIRLNFKYIKGFNDEVEIIEEENKIPEKLPYYSMEKIQKAKNKDEWREERITLLEKRVEDLHIKMNDLLDYLKSKGDE